MTKTIPETAKTIPVVATITVTREVRFSDVPTRGRKPCGGCGKFVGVRSKTCPLCGHDMKPTPRMKGLAGSVKIVAPAVDVADASGVGAPPVNVATATVAVKPPKAKRSKKATTAPVAEVAPTEGPRLSAIQTPAGLPAVKLAGATVDDVGEWLSAMQADAATKGEFLTPDAMKYHVRAFYPIDTPKYVTVATIIDALTE